MFRSFIVMAAVACAVACTAANAQSSSRRGFSARANHGYWRSNVNHRSSYRSPSFRRGVRVGRYPGYQYGGFGFFDPLWYDPYRYGSFKAPDLLDDPLFIETHRYDSHFPGRRRRRAPLMLRRTIPVPTHRSHHSPHPHSAAASPQPHRVDRATGRSRGANPAAID